MYEWKDKLSPETNATCQVAYLVLTFLVFRTITLWVSCARVRSRDKGPNVEHGRAKTDYERTLLSIQMVWVKARHGLQGLRLIGFPEQT